VFAVCCSILQYSAECVAVLSSTLQCMLQKVLATQEVVCCSVLHCDPVCVWQCVLQCVAVFLSIMVGFVYLQKVLATQEVVCCSVLQCVAVCCSVLQCVGVS